MVIACAPFLTPPMPPSVFAIVCFIDEDGTSYTSAADVMAVFLNLLHVPVSSWTMKIAHMTASTTAPSPNSAPRKLRILLVTCT
jgi:hypothetical protein